VAVHSEGRKTSEEQKTNPSGYHCAKLALLSRKLAYWSAASTQVGMRQGNKGGIPLRHAIAVFGVVVGFFDFLRPRPSLPPSLLPVDPREENGVAVPRDKTPFFSGCNSRPATFAPACSKRSGAGGNEIAQAFAAKDRQAVP